MGETKVVHLSKKLFKEKLAEPELPLIKDIDLSWDKLFECEKDIFRRFPRIYADPIHRECFYHISRWLDCDIITYKPVSYIYDFEK